MSEGYVTCIRCGHSWDDDDPKADVCSCIDKHVYKSTRIIFRQCDDSGRNDEILAKGEVLEFGDGWIHISGYNPVVGAWTIFRSYPAHMIVAVLHDSEHLHS